MAWVVVSFTWNRAQVAPLDLLPGLVRHMWGCGSAYVGHQDAAGKAVPLYLDAVPDYVEDEPMEAVLLAEDAVCVVPSREFGQLATQLDLAPWKFSIGQSVREYAGLYGQSYVIRIPVDLVPPLRAAMAAHAPEAADRWSDFARRRAREYDEEKMRQADLVAERAAARQREDDLVPVILPRTRWLIGGHICVVTAAFKKKARRVPVKWTDDSSREEISVSEFLAATRIEPDEPAPVRKKKAAAVGKEN